MWYHTLSRILLWILLWAKYDSLCMCTNVCIYVHMRCVYCAFLSIYTYACVWMYVCPYFVVCLKQCIAGVSETCRLILKVYLFVFVLFMDILNCTVALVFLQFTPWQWLTRLLWGAFIHSAVTTRILLTHIFTTTYSMVLMYTVEWTGASWRKWKCLIFETVAKGIRTRALSIEYPAFYLWALRYICNYN